MSWQLSRGPAGSAAEDGPRFSLSPRFPAANVGAVEQTRMVEKPADPRRRSRGRLRAGGDGDPFGAGGDAVGQLHIPAALAPVHLQHDAGARGRMIERLFHEQKIAPHLDDANRAAVDEQLHVDLGGMAARFQ